MIDLYTWSTPNGRKISIALEEFKLPYTVIPVDIDNDEQYEPSFLEFSPNNKIPAIVDHDTGRQMMESGAILLYLAEKTGQFLPADKWFDVLQWLMFQMAHIGPMIGQAHHFLFNNPGVSEYAEKRYHNETKRLYGVLDKRLAEHEYIVDDYSIVDMATWPWISRFERHQIDLNEFSHVKRWYLEVASRPAVQAGYDVPQRGFEIPIP